MPGLTIHKLADASVPRVKRFDPDTGESYLADPVTGQPSPRTLTGIRLEDPPDKVRVSTTVINNAVAEGWVTLENPEAVMRPAGATQDQMFSTHTGAPHFFQHADAVVFHTVDGDIRYKVDHQPDKYHADGDKKKVTAAAYAEGQTRVDHFYDLVKES